ncbi:MAG: hypothetical protein M3383_10355 [Actinomycetota bacterium]|nr:hypothetical protein [Actinomycetota bacterium]
MPLTQTSDGITLAWEQQGEGRDVIMVNYWNAHPDVFEPLAGELADRRVIRYHDRGSGDSDRVGPYDIETSAADLEAVAEAAGAARAAAVCITDDTNRAVRVAERRPELIDRVICIGGALVPRSVFADSGSDALIASDTVVGVFLAQLRTYFRGAIRSLIDVGNPQMTPAERAERVDKLIAFQQEEAVLDRLDAWQGDDEATRIGRRLGDRLEILLGESPGGAWFPPSDQLEPILREQLPDAWFTRVSSGIISAADEVAAVVRDRGRSATAGRRSAS